MRYIVSLRIQPEDGIHYNITVELEAKNIGDAIRKIARDSNRHNKNYNELIGKGVNR